ncbi:unnamed protein product [Rotaria sp. Silwood1]|nr:unnamed protein product [Rotaria sp. Silwood1]
MPTGLRLPITPIYRSTREDQYNQACMGLQKTNSSSVIPLCHVSAEVWIHSYAADVTLTQIYINQESNPIEAIYVFPIEENAAIYEFTATIDDRLITAEVKEKREAEAQYTHAIQQGQTAVLLRQSERTFDTFRINVGALPPGKECKVKIRYVTELDLIDGSSIRFVVPTTIAPRYDPRFGTSQWNDETQAQYVQNSPYSMSFRAHVDRGEYCQINEVVNMSHPLNVSVSLQTIDVSSEGIALDRDIILYIDLPQSPCPVRVAAEQYDNDSKLAILTALSPGQSNFDSILNAQNPITATTEFIFIDFRVLFNDVIMTTVYDEQTAKQAEDLARSMRADLGGTELLRPLQYLKDRPPGSGRSRQVIELCRLMSSTTRIFSFGLGHSPSRSLVKGLARATNGHFIFIPPSSRVDTYVGTQIQRALQPSFVNCRLQWFGLWPSGSQAPRTIPPGSLNRIEVRKGNTIRRLAAKALMQELQHRGSEEHVYDGRIVKQRIIDLSLTHQILSPYTAFVGVETTRSNTSTPAPVRYVPIQISTDGEHLSSQNRYPTTQSPQFIPPMEARLPPIVSPPIYAYQERMPQALVSGYTGAKGRPRVAENRSNEDITRSYQGFMEEINANTPVLQSTTQSSSVSTSTMFDSTTYDNKP